MLDEAPRPAAATPERRRWPILLAGTASAALVTALVLAAVGASGPVTAADLEVPGGSVAWLVPALRLLADLAAVLTVGCLLGATALLPGDRLLGAAGYRWLQVAGWSSGAWLLIALLAVPALQADFLGRGLSAVTLTGLARFVLENPQAQAQGAVVVLTALLAVSARVVLTMGGALVLLLLALAAALPPALAGHAASSQGTVAVTAIGLHVLGVVLWAGGLVALVLARKVSFTAVSTAAGRFSRLAGALVLVVGGSGVMLALTRLSTPAQVLETSYGVLILIKLVALVGLVTVGAWHRRSTLPALAAGRPAAFLRLATGEVLLFAATIGVAVGLSRTPTPVRADALDEAGVHELLGVATSAPPSAGALLDVYPGLFFPILSTTALVVYLAGVRRIRTAGRQWPRGRTLAWCAGWALVLLVTSSGLAIYGPVLGSAQVLQHLTVALAAPLLMVLSRPAELAVAALRPAPQEGVRGPIEWLLLFRAHPVVRTALNPVVALSVFLVVSYSVYTLDLLEWVLRSSTANIAFLSLALVAGVLFFRSLLGPDASGKAEPRGLTVRFAVLVVWAATHGFVALQVLRGGPLLAADWWSELPRIWGPLPIEDQQTAGRIAATYGVAVFFATALAILSRIGGSAPAVIGLPASARGTGAAMGARRVSPEQEEVRAGHPDPSAAESAASSATPR